MSNQQNCILLGVPLDSGKRRRGCLMGPDAYRTVALTGARNIKRLAEMARALQAEIAITAHDESLPDLRDALAGSGIACAAGPAAIADAVGGMARHIRPDPLAGMMLYALSTDADESRSLEPAARPLAGAMCEALSLRGCDMPVP